MLLIVVSVTGVYVLTYKWCTCKMLQVYVVIKELTVILFFGIILSFALHVHMNNTLESTLVRPNKISL